MLAGSIIHSPRLVLNATIEGKRLRLTAISAGAVLMYRMIRGSALLSIMTARSSREDYYYLADGRPPSMLGRRREGRLEYSGPPPPASDEKTSAQVFCAKTNDESRRRCFTVRARWNDGILYALAGKGALVHHVTWIATDSYT